jgi:hypothetical protein
MVLHYATLPEGSWVLHGFTARLRAMMTARGVERKVQKPEGCNHGPKAGSKTQKPEGGGGVMTF